MSTAISGISSSKTADKWPVYKGAWFDISYPPGFKAKPSLKSGTSTSGYDSAFFTSGDKSAEYYVFSPQWSGQPTDIALNPTTEKVVSKKSSTTRTKMETRTVTWTTISAKNGSYTRSIVDTVSSLGTRTVFAIKYRDTKTPKRYADTYARFKRSLRQYGD